jgi:hypothetical protein
MTAGSSIANTVANARASAVGGQLNIPGSQGERGRRWSGTDYFTGMGGHGPFGLGTGGVGGVGSDGQAGGGYGSGGGGGGSGTTTDRAGGRGAEGVIVVEEYD